MRLLRNIDAARWMLKRTFCRHSWVRESMYAEVRCTKCGKYDIFSPY